MTDDDKGAIDVLLMTHDQGAIDDVLMTDDQGAIDEAAGMGGSGIRWLYIDRPRWRGAEGGWENHFPSGDPKLEVVYIKQG
eukprot:gene1929-4762_t